MTSGGFASKCPRAIWSWGLGARIGRSRPVGRVAACGRGQPGAAAVYRRQQPAGGARVLDPEVPPERPPLDPGIDADYARAFERGDLQTDCAALGAHGCRSRDAGRCQRCGPGNFFMQLRRRTHSALEYPDGVQFVSSAKPVPVILPMLEQFDLLRRSQRPVVSDHGTQRCRLQDRVADRDGFTGADKARFRHARVHAA